MTARPSPHKTPADIVRTARIAQLFSMRCYNKAEEECCVKIKSILHILVHRVMFQDRSAMTESKQLRFSQDCLHKSLLMQKYTLTSPLLYASNSYLS